MNPHDLLVQHFPGYADLSQEEREAIEQFTLLWSAFEGALLLASASPAGLVNFARRLFAGGIPDPLVFDPHQEYFCARYIDAGEATEHLWHLHLDRYSKKHQALVMSFLKGELTDPSTRLAGLLLVIYRLRNNLFHGMKWAYGIRGQRDNFENANAVLMHLLKLAL